MGSHLVVQGLVSRVVPSLSSFGGDVDDEGDLAAELAQRGVGAVDVLTPARAGADALASAMERGEDEAEGEARLKHLTLAL